MLRLAGLLSFLCAIGAGYGAGHLGLTLFGAPPPQTTALAVVSADQTTVQDRPQAERIPWPDAFGVFVPEPPAPEPEPEPEPEEVRINLNYVLKGLFANGDAAWAIVSGPEGEYLLRVDDELPGGAIVAQIDTEGVLLNTPQGPQLIAFDEE